MVLALLLGPSDLKKSGVKEERRQNFTTLGLMGLKKKKITISDPQTKGEKKKGKHLYNFCITAGCTDLKNTTERPPPPLHQSFAISALFQILQTQNHKK